MENYGLWTAEMAQHHGTMATRSLGGGFLEVGGKCVIPARCKQQQQQLGNVATGQGGREFKNTLRITAPQSCQVAEALSGGRDGEEI